MKFSLNQLKQCLHEIMYKDSATVSRAVETTEDWTGAMRQQHDIIYSNLPCKLSQYKDLQADREDRAQDIKIDFRLTCDPDIVIEENDIVDVVHEGETFKLVAGTSFNYVTHKEISMRRRREAMQR